MFTLKLIFLLVLLQFSWGKNAHILSRLNQNLSQNPTIEYFTNHRHSHNTTTIKLMVHFDKTLTQKLTLEYGRNTKKKLKLKAKKLISDTENIFNHASLDQKIKFKLVDTRFLSKNIKIADENASKYLGKYCKWQGLKKINQRYYSVLLTDLDLFYLDKRGEKVRRSLGRGYKRGMCSLNNSCTVIEWHPNKLPYILAHEIAHSLGISHDGSRYNECKPQGHFMGAIYSAKTQLKKWSWSACSQRYLKEFLTSEKAWCLKPDHVNHLNAH